MLCEKALKVSLVKTNPRGVTFYKSYTLNTLKKVAITYNHPATKKIPGAPVAMVRCFQSLMKYAIPAKIMTNT